MIGFEEAVKTAKARNEKYNAVQEYSDGYCFFIDDGEIREGGGDNSIIVEKGNGQILRFAEYFLSGKYSAVEISEPKKIDDLL